MIRHSGNLSAVALPPTVDISLMVRGVTAVAVVWWHTVGYRPAPSPLSAFNLPGRIAVFIFFIVSGYVITRGFALTRYSYSADSLASFYRNRVLRIYPLFLTVSLAAIVVLLLRHQPPQIDTRFVLQQLLMLQWWHDYSLVGVFWTLGVEVQFYLLAPLLYLLQRGGRSRLLRSVLIYAVLAAVPAVSHLFFGSSWDNRTVAGNLAHFQAGIMVNHIGSDVIEKLRRLPRVRLWLLGIAGAVPVFVASHLYHYKPGAFWSGGHVLVDSGGFLILLVHRIVETHEIRPGAILKSLSLAGVLAYGLYAWHGFVLTYFPSFESRFLVTLLVSFGLAYVAYVAVERPFLNLKKARPGPAAPDTAFRRRSPLAAGWRMAIVAMAIIIVSAALAAVIAHARTARAAAAPNWFDARWNYRQKLTFSIAKPLPAGFPVMIQKTAADGPFWSHVAAFGSDIRFTDSAGRQLPFELELFDAATRRMVAWVKHAAVSEGPLYLYYGESKAKPATSSDRTWDDGYRLVLHGSELSATSETRDSSRFAHHARAEGEVTIAEGIVGNALSLGRGSSAVVIPFSGALSFVEGDWTLELWIKLHNVRGKNAGIISRGTGSVFHLYHHNENFWVLEQNNGALQKDISFSRTPLEADRWSFVAITREGGRIRIAVNGEFVEDAGDFEGFAPRPSSDALRIGSGAHGGLEGLLDEMRLSIGVARSAEWVRSSYLSQTDAILKYGGEETNSDVVDR